LEDLPAKGASEDSVKGIQTVWRLNPSGNALRGKPSGNALEAKSFRHVS
jgi:hypothetical protein